MDNRRSVNENGIGAWALDVILVQQRARTLIHSIDIKGRERLAVLRKFFSLSMY